MKFALKFFNTLVLTGLLATVGAGAALAQAPATMPAMMPASGAMPGMGMPSGRGDHMGMMGMMGHQDPAKMQAWVAKHQADLKAKLKITSQQEAAWATYAAGY